MNLTANELFNELRKYCIDNADEAMVKKYSRYFKGGYDAWGLTQALMDAKKKELIERDIITFDLIFETAPLLMKSGKYEETSFVLIMLLQMKKKFDKATFYKVESLFEIGINNWAHADTLGMLILPLFVSQNAVTISDFKPWISSEFKFQRRCVPVTFIKSLKSAPLDELLAIIDPLMKDSEREVHQGVGWFLREAWKLFPERVEMYLMKYKDTAPRLIFQYACEKMTSDNKQRFKKTKG